MLLSRYSDINFVLNLDYELGIKLINKALEKQQEDRMWLLYAGIYPNMDKKTFVPFEKFFKKPKDIKVSKRPAEEILQEAMEIHAKIKDTQQP